MTEIESIRKRLEAATACAEFVRWALSDGPWDGNDLDGASIQDKALALGLITSVPYDPVKHGETEYDVNPGDEWFDLAGAVTAIPTDIACLLSELSQSQARESAMAGIVEAALEFARCGTTLTSCSRGACQRVVESKDNSDPQAKLYSALSHPALTEKE